MTTSIEKRSLKSAVAGLISFGLTIAQSILLVPILLNFWGEEKYAVWLALWSFVMLMRLLDVGFLGLSGNEFILAYHQNHEKAKQVLGSSVRISLVLGVLEMLFFLVLLALDLAPLFTGIPIQPDQSSINKAIFIALIPWALGGSIISVIIRAIPALGMYGKMLYISLILKIVEISVLIIGGMLKASLLWISIGISTGTLLYVYFLNIYLKKIIPDFYPWWQRGTWREGFSLFRRSLALTFNTILEQYINNGIVLLISRTIGLIMLPVFTTTRTLTNIVTQITGIILDPLAPDIVRYHTNGEHYKISQLLKANWLIMNTIMSGVFGVSLLIIEPFYVQWTAKKLNFDPWLYYLLALTACVYNFGRPLVVYIRSLNLLVALNIITAFRFFFTFGLGILLIKPMGLKGLALALLMSEIFSSILVPLFFTRKLLSHTGILDFLIGILPSFNLFLLFLLFDLFRSYELFIFMAFVILSFLLMIWQWHRLSEEVKLRITSLIPSFKTIRK